MNDLHNITNPDGTTVTIITNPCEITRIMEAAEQAREAIEAMPLPITMVEPQQAQQEQPKASQFTEEQQEQPKASQFTEEQHAKFMLHTKDFSHLGLAMFNAISPLIEAMVSKHFLQLVDTHKTLGMLDASSEARMREIATEEAAAAVSDHEQSEDHLSEDHIQDMITSSIEHDRDIVSRDSIEEMISDAISEHEYDKEHLDESDVESKAEEAAQTVVDDYMSENINEAVKQAVSKLTFTVTINN